MPLQFYRRQFRHSLILNNVATQDTACYYSLGEFAPVAQRTERWSTKPKAAGSNPVWRIGIENSKPLSLCRAALTVAMLKMHGLV